MNSCLNFYWDWNSQNQSGYGVFTQKNGGEANLEAQF